MNCIHVFNCPSLLALRRHVRHGNLPRAALQTADFVEKCNSLFDLFNVFGHMPSTKKPVTRRNAAEVLAVSSSYTTICARTSVGLNNDGNNNNNMRLFLEK